MKASKNNSKKKELMELIIKEKIPQHVAVIMDGNGRWAKERMLPRSFGHKAGVETLRSVIETASELHIQYLSVYAFSTENWKRTEQEVSTLMKLLLEYLKKEVSKLHNNNVKMNIIGDINRFSHEIKEEIIKAQNLTKLNTGLCVNLALNYGSRDEIIRAVNKLCHEAVNRQVNPDEIDEKMFSAYLDTGNIPDPDLLIRTGGECRLSNYFLWQCAYTELWFTDTYWPDFNREYFIEAILDFQNRNRRFGAV